MSQKSQKLTIRLVAIRTDIFGVIEVDVILNNKLYTYPITSEFALRKVQSLLYRHKPGRALKVLEMFKVRGFNAFEKGGVT